MEEEPAVHPEPIDDPGKDAGTGAGRKDGAEQFWRNHEKSGRKKENRTKTPQFGVKKWVSATKIASKSFEIPWYLDLF